MIYTSNDAFSLKEVPCAVSMIIVTFNALYFPKFEDLHYGLWQPRTAIIRASLKIEARCLHQSRGFWGRAI